MKTIVGFCIYLIILNYHLHQRNNKAILLINLEELPYTAGQYGQLLI